MTDAELRLFSKLFNSLKQEVSLRFENEEIIKRLAFNIAVEECEGILKAYKDGQYDPDFIKQISEE